ncbi:TetR/AcrR family transcriptional regulator [Nocardiopsis sp. MG754419]|uniref:TetR/AcrR family transcriptional regulator n=1 Tax=Nocardiopsis sp. MG754419 TaxID=2259865 RepID=UPI001BA64466|nr:TetR/AcrR family transcriptional regulator [Nocardiopsis sp. MG754419]MBR8743960.1 TetR/AcrR family transcriptional regulator [Nocardiopsis sp. MG754419]
MARTPKQGRAGRGTTLIERVRRAQLVEVTVDLIAELGYAKTSLARIAEGADLTKAAVLYHFPSKDALVRAACAQVLETLTEEVGAALASAPAADGPTTYVRAMVGHLRAHPRHTRVIVEAFPHLEDDHTSERRWGPLAGIIDTAAEARGLPAVDSRSLAVIIGGAIDGLVGEALRDPDYDTTGPAERLNAMIESALSG